MYKCRKGPFTQEDSDVEYIPIYMIAYMIISYEWVLKHIALKQC